MAHGGEFLAETVREGTDRTVASATAEAVRTDWRTADLSPADQALCAFALKVTTTPAACGPDDLAPLRDAGFDDTAIHDAAQVIGYFNYVNRIADCLGVDLEPEMQRE